MYIFFQFTDTFYVNGAAIYLSAILFLLAIFPVHVINYVYLSTEDAYASVNVSLYRLITVANFNVDKISLGKKREEKDKKTDILFLARNWLKLYNKLCITKIVQLGDYGVLNGDNCYAALVQNTATDILYSFVKINGGRTKLKNYAVLNYEHKYIKYYMKCEGVINLITLARLLLIYIWGKFYELQTKTPSKG